MIAVIDSDDLMSPNRLSDQYKIFIEQPKTSFLSGGCVVSWKHYLDLFRPKKMRLQKRDLFFNPVINPTVSFRRDVFLKLGGYNINYHYGEDLDLTYRVVREGITFLVTDDIWCTYREKQLPKTFVQSLNVAKIHYKNFNRIHLATLFLILDILIIFKIYKPKSWIKTK